MCSYSCSRKGVWRLGRLPQPLLGSIFASLAALAMGAYIDALGNVTRAVFNVAGPILSLSVAVLFTSPPFPADASVLNPPSSLAGVSARERRSSYHCECRRTRGGSSSANVAFRRRVELCPHEIKIPQPPQHGEKLRRLS
jgi:hypothetical protein